ncbi:MAG: TIGR01459 family HAD-type hydrolase [Rhizobiaceae bacterium]
MLKPVPTIDGLHQLVDRYDCILCDVWGVLHNGRELWTNTTDALSRARKAGLAVIMITNAPRPRGPVLRQLERLGCPDNVFDELVTSGDVTRELIRQLEGPVFNIGPGRDHTLYEGLDVTFTERPGEAAGIVCTGLYDDYNEHPSEYVERFKQYIGLDLPFICANPDIVVEVIDKLLWCAGALAREYDQLGGETRIVGKPYAPIYDVSTSHAEKLLDKPLDKSRILAIGDGLPTDIKGAEDYGIDALFITNGIHAADYTSGEVDDSRLQNFLAKNNASPTAWIKTLVW